MCLWEFLKNVGPEDTEAAESSTPFWTKEKEAGVWDFKGKGGNSKVGKEQTCGQQILAGPPRTMGHKGEFFIS